MGLQTSHLLYLLHSFNLMSCIPSMWVHERVFNCFFLHRHTCAKRADESGREFVSAVCVGVYLSRALSFIPFDVLLSVNHGRTDALPLIWGSMVKGKH